MKHKKRKRVCSSCNGMGCEYCNYESLYCEHGKRLPEHPEYDRTVDGCRDCEVYEWADMMIDEERGT